MYANQRMICIYLDSEGEQVVFPVAPADPLAARGHVQGPGADVVPVAGHPRLSDHPAVVVVPGFVQGPPETKQKKMKMKNEDEMKMKNEREK